MITINNSFLLVLKLCYINEHKVYVLQGIGTESVAVGCYPYRDQADMLITCGSMNRNGRKVLRLYPTTYPNRGQENHRTRRLPPCFVGA